MPRVEVVQHDDYAGREAGELASVRSVEEPLNNGTVHSVTAAIRRSAKSFAAVTECTVPFFTVRGSEPPCVMTPGIPAPQPGCRGLSPPRLHPQSWSSPSGEKNGAQASRLRNTV